jgi:hypothetical protein
MKRMLICVILTVLLIPGVFASEAGGGGGPQTKYFNIRLEPSKKVYSPGDVMEIKIFVTDKKTGEKVDNARVYVSLDVYKGKKFEKIEAKNLGEGVYLLEQKIETNAKWGGVTVSLEVSEDGRTDTIQQVISFMRYNVYAYGIFVTLTSIIIGIGVGMAFGGVKH